MPVIKGKLPDKKVVRDLVGYRVASSRILQVVPKDYDVDEMLKQIEAIYSGVDENNLDGIPDISENCLQEEVLQTLGGFLNKQGLSAGIPEHRNGHYDRSNKRFQRFRITRRRRRID